MHPRPQYIRLRRLETGDFQIKFEVHIGQGLELERKDLALPAGQFCQAIVSDDVGTPLGLGQGRELYCRDFGDPSEPPPRYGHDQRECRVCR